MGHLVTQPSAPFRSNTGNLEVWQVPAARDNLVWLLVDPRSQDAAAVDGPGATEVLASCERNGFRLTTILNTHTHADHIGLNRELAATGHLAGLRVVGPASRCREIPGITEPVHEGTRVAFGAVTGRTLLTEGHLDGHVSYVFEDVLFCGDTLFGAGCGFLFDGPPEKMYASLERLAQLPKDTKVCCAHEYTEDNLLFAWSIEPDNDALRDRIHLDRIRRARGESTLPSTIAVERATNPFLRVDSPSIQRALRTQVPDATLSEPRDVFAALRALKDSKRYQQTTVFPP